MDLPLLILALGPLAVIPGFRYWYRRFQFAEGDCAFGASSRFYAWILIVVAMFCTPMPYFNFVSGGVIPPIYLLLESMSTFFVSAILGLMSIWFCAFALPILWMLVFSGTNAIFRLPRPWMRTLAICCIFFGFAFVALMPIWVKPSHSQRELGNVFTVFGA